MIVILWFLCGFAGLLGGYMIALGWHGAAMLFGFPLPTADQVNGLAVLLASVGTVGSALLTGVCIFIFDR